MSIRVDFENLEALRDEFSGLERKVRLKVLRQASRRGAKVVQKDAVRFAPEDEGDLKGRIKVRSAKSATGGRLPRGTVGHSVGVDRKQFPETFYASFQFLGTQHIDATETLREALAVNHGAIEKAYTRQLRQSVDAIARESKAK